MEHPAKCELLLTHCLPGKPDKNSYDCKLLNLWWRTQSHSNLSPPANSLLTGKLTGNYVKFACWARFCTLTRQQIQRLAAKIPTQQNREFLRRSREFAGENREFERAIEQSDFRMMFSEGRDTVITDQHGDHRSMTMSPSGCEQQISTLPSAGPSTGTGR